MHARQPGPTAKREVNGNRRLAQISWVQGFARWARGDPSLSIWEELFLRDLNCRATARAQWQFLTAEERAALEMLVERTRYMAGPPPLTDDV